MMIFPDSETIPDPLPSEQPAEPLPPARRRRQRRVSIPLDEGEQAAFLGELAHQATPSFDFFLFSLLAGLVLGAAILLDAPALYVLAALLAPFMAPIVGLSLAAVTGLPGFFIQSLAAMGIGGLLVFGMGALAGLVGKQLLSASPEQAFLHAHFSWPDLAIVLLGTAVTAILLVRAPRSRPLVSSAALAYGLYLPLGVAGFGLVAGVAPGLWPDALLLFVSHLAAAVLLGALILIVAGLHPHNLAGYLVGLLLIVIVLLAGLGFSGFLPGFASLQGGAPVPAVTATGLPSSTPSITLLPTLSGTPPPPTTTRTPTRTIIPSATPSLTLAPSPTPIFALVNAGIANGIIVRAEPGSDLVVTTLLNGNLVIILPETTSRAGVTWTRIRTLDGKDGWVQAGLLLTATPKPR